MTHPAEAADERRALAKALAETRRAFFAAEDDAERLDISRRSVRLAQRFKLIGGHIEDVPGHEHMRWKK
jgi:hypothetical protein